MTTIRDVAKECGVSAMTVSAVLNNRPGQVSPETRSRVLRIVKEMGYQPNAVARGLTRRRMNTLGVVLSYEGKSSLTADRYFSPVLDGIFAENSRRRQKTLIITGNTWEEVKQNLPNYQDGHCDGLLFVLPIMPGGTYDGLLQRGLPFVLIGQGYPEPGLATVDLDNVQVAYDAVRYLMDQGHRRVGFLNGDRVLLSSGQREAGFRRALAAGELACDERWVLSGHYSTASGYERTRELLGRRDIPFPTALFCADDAIAIGAWQALTEQGQRVPEDVSLIGINDDKEISTMGVGLTTIRQPLQELGERAVDVVLAQIDRKAEPGEKIQIQGKLVVRGSIGRPKDTAPIS